METRSVGNTQTPPHPREMIFISSLGRSTIVNSHIDVRSRAAKVLLTIHTRANRDDRHGNIYWFT